MTWQLAYASCKIAAICEDNHHQTTLPSKIFLVVSTKHMISAVVHLNVSQPTKKQSWSDRPTRNCGTIRNSSNMERYAAECILTRTCKLTFIHSLVTCSFLYIPQDFLLFVIILLTFSTTASHGSTKTEARCESFWIELNDGCFIKCAPAWDTAAAQWPVIPPRRWNCSHQNMAQDLLSKNVPKTESSNNRQLHAIGYE
jgi:hypothetical protein